MKPKTILTLYKELEESALNSKLVQEVVLVKTQAEVEQRVEDNQYRTLYAMPDLASIYTENDEITFQLTVVDKTNFDNDSYLYSINDAVALLKTISDDLNYKMNNHVILGNVTIGSDAYKDGIMTSVTCAMDFAITYLPNIHNGD